MTVLDSPMVAGTISTYRQAQERLFLYRFNADTARLTALAFGFALLTGLAAQIRVPLPFTPVPITLQTFAVLLAGVVLGMRYGGLSQAIYVGGGILGMPWFQGMASGLGYAAGPTGGYLVGFVVAAVFIGFVVDRSPFSRRLPVLIGVLAVANFGIIYLFGLTWLFVWSTVLTGGMVGLIELLYMGAVPFLVGDVVKLIAAALFGATLLPARSVPGDGSE